MEKIIIKDNFLDEKEYNLLLNIIEEKEYSYGHTSGDREIITNKFFSVFNKEYFFIENMLQKIIKNFSMNFTINRHYMHIQIYGQDGGYHYDDNKENTYTFCIYVHNITNHNIYSSSQWFEGIVNSHMKLRNDMMNSKNETNTINFDNNVEIEKNGEKIGGEFFIKIPGKKEILCIEPLSNRCIFFPSKYLHKGMAFNRFYSNYRLCITWKLELI